MSIVMVTIMKIELKYGKAVEILLKDELASIRK